MPTKIEPLPLYVHTHRYLTWLHQDPDPAVKQRQRQQLADARDQYLDNGGEIEELDGFDRGQDYARKAFRYFKEGRG